MTKRIREVQEELKLFTQTEMTKAFEEGFERGKVVGYEAGYEATNVLMGIVSEANTKLFHVQCAVCKAEMSYLETEIGHRCKTNKGPSND